MNDTVCPQLSPDVPSIILPSAYILVFGIGLGANMWGLKFLLLNWRKLGDVNILLLNLGLADFLYLLTLPFLMAYHFRESQWIFGDVFCKITRFCFNLNLYGCIGFLTCISVYRYLAIVHPLRTMGRITSSNSAALSVTVWLLVSVQSLPDMFYPKTSSNDSQKCFETTSDDHVEEYWSYRLGWTLSGFCVPFLLTLGCYGHVVAVLCSKDSIDVVLKRRVLRLCFVLILLFSLCYIPFHVFKILNLWSRVLSKRRICPRWNDRVYDAHRLSRALVCLNSALNPLVYLPLDERVSARFWKLLHTLRQVFTKPPTISGAAGDSEITPM